MTLISNNPYAVNKITEPWAYVDNLFTEDELAEIIDYCSSKELSRSNTVNNDSKVRVSSNFFNDVDAENSWFIRKINEAIVTVNDRFYGFDLYGYSFFQYAEYDGSENGKYDAHLDLIMGSAKPTYMLDTRKLSVTILLSEPDKDFTGGDFFIHQSAEATNLKMSKGQMIFFPSFMLHGVKPVTSGIRKSIVIWVEGPKFK